MFLRSKRRRSREVSLYEPIGTDKEGNEINLLDVIESTPVDIVEDCYMRENTSYLLRSLKDTLTEKEYQVICCRYGLFGEEEQTQREIAHRLSISRSYVSRNRKNAIEKLRVLFENKLAAANIFFRWLPLSFLYSFIQLFVKGHKPKSLLPDPQTVSAVHEVHSPSGFPLRHRSLSLSQTGSVRPVS